MAKYKRVLLKLSGEAMAGDNKFGFDEETCKAVAMQIKGLVDEGIQVAIVTGCSIVTGLVHTFLVIISTTSSLSLYIFTSS